MALSSAAAALRILILVQAGLILAIGLPVVGGWLLDAPRVVRLHPALPPMAFNTALWMTCCGIGLASTTSRQYQWIAKVLGALVLATALATMVEYRFDLDLGIDQALLRADLLEWPGHPRRPAANTAVAFALASTGLLLHGRPMSIVRGVLMGLCGAGASALAAVSLVSHALALGEGTLWLVGGEAMAMHTAVGLVFLGSGLATLAWFVSDHALPPRWIPFAVGALGVTATVVFWQSAVSAERVHVQQVVDREAIAIRDALALRMTGHVMALVRMAQRWETSCAPGLAEWRADAALLYAHANDFQTIEWWDSAGVERWVEPTTGDEAARERDPSSAAVRHAAFAAAQRRGRSPSSSPISLTPAGAGVLVIVPIIRSEQSDGAIVGIFRMDKLVTNVLPQHSDVSVEVLEGLRLVYERRVPEAQSSLMFRSTLAPSRSTTWHVRTVPGAALFERERSFIPTAILSAGFTVSMLLTMIGLLLDSTVRRSMGLRVAHRDLGAQAASLTEQTRALEEARDQALSATRAKSTFLATMSHEIRTPMNALLGTSDLLWESELTDEQRDHVRMFRSNSERLLGLVNDILDLSKVESGHLVLDEHPFDLARVVSEILELMKPAADKKRLSLTHRIASDVPSTLVGDGRRLKQMLTNLLGNAIKFTEAGSVALAITAADGDERSVMVSMAVTDTGEGIPAAKLEAIFDPFVQADSSVTRRHGGTGLGLPICRRLAELMGGSVRVESRVDVGSTFTCTARFRRAAEAQIAAHTIAPAEKVVTSVNGQGPVNGLPALTPSASAPLRVLLADDARDNVVLVRAFVRDAGVQLEVAENGAVAVERFRADRYDLVLMDIQMPIVDGHTATRQIRAWEAEQQLPRTPIIALSAHALQEEAQQSLDAGCDAHLTKPIRKQTLLQAIDRYGRTTRV